MSSNRSNESTGQAPPLLPILLIGVILLSVAGIAAVLLDLPNPFARERKASAEAIEFYATEVAALDVAAKDIVQQAEFNVTIDDTAQCVESGGEGERCVELRDRFQGYVVRMDELLVKAESLEPPASDGTTADWVEAFRRERSEDRDGLESLATAAAAEWNGPAWSRGLENFRENPERGASDKALQRMLPNRQDFSRIAVNE